MNVTEAVTSLKGRLADTDGGFLTDVEVDRQTLRTVVDWVQARIAEQPGQFWVGDKVKLAVSENPDEGEPEIGVIIGRSGLGYRVRPDAGPYSDTKTGLYYGPHEVSSP